MNIEIMTIKCLDDNYAYLLHNHEKNETFLIDAPEATPIIKKLKEKNWKLDKIFITHHHSDHVMGLNELSTKYNPTILGSESDSHRLPKLDEKLKVNQILNLGDFKFDVIDVPGHTIGHIALFSRELESVFTGDSLMVFGCGKLFEGTPSMMWKTLNKLKKLPENTKVYSGHEYALKNLEFAISIDQNNNELHKKLTLIKNKLEKGIPSVPSTIKDELGHNIFLRANSPQIKRFLNMENETAEHVFAELRRRRDIF